MAYTRRRRRTSKKRKAPARRPSRKNPRRKRRYRRNAFPGQKISTKQRAAAQKKVSSMYKRARAARKAAKTRAYKRGLAAGRAAARRSKAPSRRKRRSSSPRRSRRRISKATRAKLRRAGRKGARTRARRKWRRSRPAARRARRRSPGRHVTKRRGRGVKAALRRRYARRYQSAYGSGRVRAIMRKNPLGAIKTTLKAALPVVISMYGGKFVSAKLLPLVPGLDRLGRHAAPVGSALMVVVGHYATKKVRFLGKHRDAVMLGLGINAIDVILRTYMPQNVKDMVGMGNDEAIYDGALSEYVSIGDYEAEMGEYVSIGDYEAEMGEYVSIGAEEELGLGATEELGSLGANAGAFVGSHQGIGSGIGMPPPPAGGGGLVKRVPSRSFTAPVPARSFTKTVPTAGAAFDNLSRLYTGIFRGGFGC